MKQNILVVGATGTVGTEIVKGLKAEGRNVRSATSKSGNIPADQVHLNLQTGEGRSEAFKGIDRVFMLSPGGLLNQDALLIPLIDEAKKHSIKKVVLMTAMGANANPEAPLARVEQALEKSGLSYNIIRPNWFFQNFNTFWLGDILEAGNVLLPAGTAKVSFIDARDISAVAVKLLSSDEFNNQAFELTGPEAIDHNAVVQVLSEVSGKKIGYKEISPSEFKVNITKRGVSPEYADFLNLILGFLREGYSAGITDSVQKITGKKPRSVLTYAQDNKQNWS